MITIDKTHTIIAALGDQKNILENVNPATVVIADNIATNSGTTVTLSVKLPGIGVAVGDNHTPLHATRSAQLTLIDTGGIASTVSGSLLYQKIPGIFSGTFSLSSSLATGVYQGKIKAEDTLRQSFPALITLHTGENTTVSQPLPLISGDITNTNTLAVTDYSKFVKQCAYTAADSLAHKPKCPLFNAVDLNDDGVIDSIDLNIFQRGLAQRAGD